jgi:hypothetical protein
MGKQGNRLTPRPCKAVHICGPLFCGVRRRGPVLGHLLPVSSHLDWLNWPLSGPVLATMATMSPESLASATMLQETLAAARVVLAECAAAGVKGVADQPAPAGSAEAPKSLAESRKLQLSTLRSRPPDSATRRRTA